MRAHFQKHARVIAALVIREMTTRFGNKIGGYLWAIVGPVAFILMLSFLFSAFARTPPLGRSFILFYATGYLPYGVFQTISSRVAASVQSNRALLNYPIVAPLDTIVARSLLELSTQFVVFTMILTAISFLIPDFPSIQFARLFGATAIAVALGFGVGSINCVLFQLSGLYERVYSIATRPLLLISGVMFIPESIPHPFRDYLLWNPLAHVIGLFRQAFYPAYRAFYLDIPWLVSISLGTIVLGLGLLHIFGQQIREAG